MKKLLITVLFLNLLTCSINNKTHNIKGVLLGSDGKPMVQANVQLLSNEPTKPAPVSKSFNVNSDGTYSIPLSNEGFFKLRFCGVNHQSEEQPILLYKLKDIVINVQLKAIEVKKEIESIKIMGDFNNFSWRKNTIEMEKSEDKNYYTTLKTNSDSLAYQILGVDKNGHSINGTQSDFYILDRGGDYISIIKTKGMNEVTIKYDLSSLEYPQKKSTISFTDSNSFQEEVIEILADLKLRKDNMLKSYRKYVKDGGEPGSFKYDWSKDIDELNELWGNEKKLDIKEVRYWAKFTIGEVDSIEAIKSLEHIPPTSPFWSIEPAVLSNIIYKTKNDSTYLEYIQQLIYEHPDSTIKPFFLGSAIYTAHKYSREDLVQEFYQEFINKYSSSPRLKSIKAKYSPDRKIQIGRSVPEFNFISIDDSSKFVNKNSLLGKIYLIDFWATWCGPCVKEMEYLHKAYEKYKEKGLKIISVSLDFRYEDLTKFREGKWKLPWFNAFEKYSNESAVVKNFELVSIPKPVLIDAKGKIIATGLDIRGENLDNTLSKYFK